jgi:hypothetical protein
VTAAVRRRLASRIGVARVWRVWSCVAGMHALHTRARRACVYLARPVSVESVESLMNFGETAESNINSRPLRRSGRAGARGPPGRRAAGFARSAAWSASSCMYGSKHHVPTQIIRLESNPVGRYVAVSKPNPTTAREARPRGSSGAAGPLPESALCGDRCPRRLYRVLCFGGGWRRDSTLWTNGRGMARRRPLSLRFASRGADSRLGTRGWPGRRPQRVLVACKVHG